MSIPDGVGRVDCSRGKVALFLYLPLRGRVDDSELVVPFSKEEVRLQGSWRPALK